MAPTFNTYNGRTSLLYKIIAGRRRFVKFLQFLLRIFCGNRLSFVEPWWS